MWHILYLGDLPYWPVSQPESSIYNIVPTHHESMSAVLVMTVKKVVMVLYGHAVVPFCVPAMHSLGVSS